MSQNSRSGIKVQFWYSEPWALYIKHTLCHLKTSLQIRAKSAGGGIYFLKIAKYKYILINVHPVCIINHRAMVTHGLTTFRVDYYRAPYVAKKTVQKLDLVENRTANV